VKKTQSRLLTFMHLDMGPAQHVRGGDGESRLIYHVRGGYFEGTDLSGKIPPVIGDWVSVKDGQVTMDVRVRLVTDDGVAICMAYQGITAVSAEQLKALENGERIAATNHYFGVTPVLEVSDDAYAWLRKAEVFGIASRYDDSIEYHLYEKVTVEDHDAPVEHFHTSESRHQKCLRSAFSRVGYGVSALRNTGRRRGAEQSAVFNHLI